MQCSPIAEMQAKIAARKVAQAKADKHQTETDRRPARPFWWSSAR